MNPHMVKVRKVLGGWCWEMTPMISRGTCSTTFPDLRPLFLLDIGWDLGHLGWEPPSSYASLYRDHPVGWRAWGEKTRSQAGMRSISLLVGDVLELCIFILHPTLSRPPLHSSVTAHLLPVLQN